MIIPFEPNMYRSEIDRYIGEHDNLSFNEIRGYFRIGLDNALYIAANKQYTCVRMHADKASINADLNYIYKSSGYDYRVVPIEVPEDENVKDKLTRKLKERKEEKNAPPYHGSKVENGEVRSYSDKQERFMAKSIINPEMFQTLNQKYETSVYLFITQLDLVNAKGQDYRAFEQGTHKRQMKVHYSIFTSDEKEVYSGVVEREFSGSENSIKKIIVKNLPPLAEQIIADLPVLSLTNQ